MYLIGVVYARDKAWRCVGADYQRKRERGENETKPGVCGCPGTPFGYLNLFLETHSKNNHVRPFQPTEKGVYIQIPGF